MGRRPLAAQTPEDGDPSALTLDSGAAFGSAALCARSRAGLSRPEQAGAALHISTRRSGSGFPWRAGERAETSGARGAGRRPTHRPRAHREPGRLRRQRREPSLEGLFFF